MTKEKALPFVTGLCGYRAGLVSPIYLEQGEPWAITVGVPLTFDHVLSVPSSEELWPEDAKELFFRELFATRFVGGDEVYLKSGVVWDHMREEVQRLRFGPKWPTLEAMWIATHMVDCYEYKGGYATILIDDGFASEQLPHENLFIEDLSARKLLGSFPSSFPGDGSDDDYEDDTLNSELLLTQEYQGPHEIKRGQMGTLPMGRTLDARQQTTDGQKLSPRRPVRIKPTTGSYVPPTEQEE